jgi:hypothetical protein
MESPEENKPSPKRNSALKRKKEERPTIAEIRKEKNRESTPNTRPKRKKIVFFLFARIGNDSKKKNIYISI